ncbi:MAG: TIGR01777 family oxidoreductase [Bdellovibrionales bacterium]
MRILLSGATGLIGKNFIRRALREGHEVVALVRRPEMFKMLPKENIFAWSHEQVPPAEAFDGVQAVVHFAGAGVADKRWTSSRKNLIRESRLVGTRNLVKAIESLSEDRRPDVFVSGSAIGYYGYHRKEEMTEESPPGDDFLAHVCTDWEKEAQALESLGVRLVLARTGIVLSKEGGALAKMPPVVIGSGDQWFSWIHIDDMVGLLLFSIMTSTVKGPLNFVAPAPVHFGSLIRSLVDVRGYPAALYSPAFTVRLGLGEMANALLSSLKVLSSKAESHGFQFQFQEVNEALENLYSGTHYLDQVFVQDQFVPRTPKQVFPFFSRAENLEILTPPFLNFKIVAKSSEEIQTGTLIDYRLRVHGVPISWRTLIQDWIPDKQFVDEQLKGPYSKWHHVHSFDSVVGGCLLRDEVTYRVPAHLLGKLALTGFILKDVKQIFSYRQKKIEELVASNAI